MLEEADFLGLESAPALLEPALKPPEERVETLPFLPFYFD
jgi:hypothetical protein